MQPEKTVTTVETTAPAAKGPVTTKVTVTTTRTPIEAFGRWAAGVISGFIRGGAHAVASGTTIQVLDPATLHEALIRFGYLFLFHGALSTFMYLQSHPIPDEWDPTRPEETDRRSRNGNSNGAGNGK